MPSTSIASKEFLQHALELENLYDAWEKVRKNKGAAGGDFISLARFERRLELNLSRLAESVQRGTYRPGKVRIVRVNTGRKLRDIAVWCVADRVLQRAVLNILEPVYERLFTHTSFGYRRGLSVAHAVQRVLYLRDRGYVWVVDADIRECFPSLDHKLIISLLRQRIVDQDLLDLFSLLLPYGRSRALRRSEKPVGISLGAVISPLICNIYLHQLDTVLAKERLQSIRYADDFVVLCRCEKQRDRAIETVRSTLGSILLQLNDEKTRLTNFEEGFTFLGVSFKGRKYSYQWYEKRVEASDMAESFPMDIDGYRDEF